MTASTLRWSSLLKNIFDAIKDRFSKPSEEYASEPRRVINFFRIIWIRITQFFGNFIRMKHWHAETCKNIANGSLATPNATGDTNFRIRFEVEGNDDPRCLMKYINYFAITMERNSLTTTTLICPGYSISCSILFAISCAS